MNKAFSKYIKNYPVGYALLAALLFGLNAPLSKLLLDDVPPLFMAAFLYLGAGVGMMSLRFFNVEKKEAPLSKKEFPWAIGMILLDVAAPVLLMYGLKYTSAANASLLFNFEMVATSLIAYIFFKEAVGRRIWLALGMITIASIVLTLDFSNVSNWKFSGGSFLVLAACCCWGLENNCTKNMSEKSPAQIVVLKGFGSGLTALIIAFAATQEVNISLLNIIYAMLVGFTAYGLSIFFYVKAQRYLGAARTSAYYAAAPFAGVLLSVIILREMPSWSFYAAFILMLAGVWLIIKEEHSHDHIHEKLTHNHAHSHDDLHHDHQHDSPVTGTHFHEHTHEKCAHRHPHTPDIHHNHAH